MIFPKTILVVHVSLALGAGKTIYKKGFIVGDIVYSYHENGIAQGPFVQVSEGFRLIGTFKHDKVHPMHNYAAPRFTITFN
jgi:hypothetical protein